MRITPAQNLTGDIVVQGKISSLSVGRQVVATVLSNPKDGLVMVSMFGRQFLVETTLDLVKGQTLNLKVHETTPKVILKPVDVTMESNASAKTLDSLVERLVGKFGENPVASFDLREIMRKLVKNPESEPAAMQYVAKLVEEYFSLPQGTVVYLLIPFVDDESRGSARIAVSRAGDDYRLHFDVQTDALGMIESTVVRSRGGIAVEISSPSDEVVDFLRAHLGDLARSLEQFGVKGIEMLQKKSTHAHCRNVDMLV